MAQVTTYPCQPCGVNPNSAYPGRINQEYNLRLNTGRVLVVPENGVQRLRARIAIPGAALLLSDATRPLRITAGVYVADNLVAGVPSATVLETAGGAVVVGAITQTAQELVFSINFPTVLPDRTIVRVSFFDTAGKAYNIVIAEALISNPCARRHYVQPVACYNFVAQVCTPNVCDGQAPFLTLNNRAVATMQPDRSFKSIEPGAAQYTYNFTGVATPVVLTSVGYNGLGNRLTGNLTGVGGTLALQLVNLAGQLNTAAFPGVYWTATATELIARATQPNTLQGIAGTGNAVAFSLTPAVVPALGGAIQISAFVLDNVGVGSAGCGCEGSSLSRVYAYFPTGVPCGQEVAYVNGQERVRMNIDQIESACLSVFDFAAVTEPLIVNSLTINGVNALDDGGAIVATGANLAEQLVSLAVQLTDLGYGTFIPTATALSVRSVARITSISGTGNAVAFAILANGTGQPTC